MRLSVTIILAAVATMVQAAPAVSENGGFHLDKRKSVNDCYTSTFVDETSGASPKVSDCLVIAKNIAGGGTWTTPCGKVRQLVSFGTCALDVYSNGPCGSLVSFDYYKVGNQDIIDLIHSSIDKFAHNGLVGAKGNMPCQQAAGIGSDPVQWGIYHT